MLENVDQEGRVDVIEIIDAEGPLVEKQVIFACDICNNTFQSTRSLAMHRRFHKRSSKSTTYSNIGRVEFNFFTIFSYKFRYHCLRLSDE